MKIILASKSPRRKELLSQIGLEYECIVSNREEKILETQPDSVVERLSCQKAEDVEGIILNTAEYGKYLEEGYIIIGADTVVALEDEIMGKPKDRDDEIRMMKRLKNRSHSVWTGVTLIFKGKNIDKRMTYSQETKVYMYDLSDGEIDEYADTEEPYDKAGGYGIQGMASRFIEKIDGDYNNVVGLPVAGIYRRIRAVLQSETAI